MSKVRNKLLKSLFNASVQNFKTNNIIDFSQLKKSLLKSFNIF